MFTQAITRKPAVTFAQGITIHQAASPDYNLMAAQHDAYVQTLRSLGLTVTVLESLPDYPDAYFVEDVAVILPEIAVITRPGAAARKGETAFIEPVLAAYKPIVPIQRPGTMDGGDILVVGQQLFIGISERTNKEGAAQLSQIAETHGYTSTAVSVVAGLHLKSSVNYVGKNTLLLTASFAKYAEFETYNQIILDEDEVDAGNTLFINGSLIMPAGFPKTRQKLNALGLPIIELDVSEAAKMDGGLTCMSLRF